MYISNILPPLTNLLETVRNVGKLHIKSSNIIAAAVPLPRRLPGAALSIHHYSLRRHPPCTLTAAALLPRARAQPPSAALSVHYYTLR